MYELTHATTLLIQAAHVLPDTLVTKQLPPGVGNFDRVAQVTSWLMSLVVLVAALGLAPAIWSLRKTYRKLNDLIDRVSGEVTPLARNAGVLTDDAREIVTMVKGDVRQIQQTVAAANARLLKAVKEAEARLDEFNALIEVVQEEAESAFVGTASTVHGVRTGFAQVFDNTEEFEDGGDENGASTGATGATGANATKRPRHSPRRRSDLS